MTSKKFRIIINTLSNVLALNFERVEFNYGLDEDKPDILSVRNRRPATVPTERTAPKGRVEQSLMTSGDPTQYRQSHSYLRAQKMKQVEKTQKNEKIL